ncbi:pantothenate transporter [Apiospora aurea]|uniref:Pantothenate transporter n=1 Tax=Apiospora aurea TaxID=335848 RepID=A0ABR1QGY2_9PEZI
MSDPKDLAMATKAGPAGIKAPSEELVDSNSSSGVPSVEISTSDDERSRARQLLTPDEGTKLLRRIDWHLMPLCSIIFMSKNLDSDNVSNARIMDRGTERNIMAQLGMSSNAYALVTIPYIIREAPSNLLIERLSPSKWQSRIVVSWGIVLGLHCLARNSAGLYTARFFLGLFEAGQFPGVILQMCYCGILAFAFDHLSGYGGLSGWQWLFLVESLATVVMGVIVWFTLPDCKQADPLFPTPPPGYQKRRKPSSKPASHPTHPEHPNKLSSSARSSPPSKTSGSGCYGILVAYPSNAAVYAATLLGNAATAAWYPTMRPWRVQTTQRATGSAFAIGFVNSYGQIGGAVGPQLFREDYAPRYRVSFGVAMGLVGACVGVTLGTWYLTRRTERETRRVKRGEARGGEARRGVCGGGE